MLKNLTKAEIDSIYNEYQEIRDEIIKDIISDLYGKRVIQYLQHLLFALFMIPALTKNDLIKSNEEEKCSSEVIFNSILNSRDKKENLHALFTSFGKNQKKTSYIIRDKELIIQLPITIRAWFSKDYYKERNYFDDLEISKLVKFSFEKIKQYGSNVTESFSTIFERDMNYYDFLSSVEEDKEKNTISRQLTDRRKKGVYYTPPEITSFMTKETILSILSQKMAVPLEKLADIKSIDNRNSLKTLYDILSKLRILDITSGSGEFLLATARILFELQKSITGKLSLKISDAEIKRIIIESNLFGADLMEEALSISRINLWLWFISNQDVVAFDSSQSIDLDFNLVSGNSLIGFVNNHMKEIENIDEGFLHYLNKKRKKNNFKINELLEMNPIHWCERFPNILGEGGFDLVIGNPPYIEIKKIRNKTEKEFFSRLYYSAYKLYDISILFIERAQQLLKEDGLLSFIITNKFLSTDFGENIREIILTQSKILSIIDVSYLPVFQDASIYPIILTLEKAIKNDKEENLENQFYVSSKIEDLKELEMNSFGKYYRKQIDFYQLPKMIFNISANLELIQSIMNNPLALKLDSYGKFAYRVLGFTDWNKNVKQITENRMSNSDFRIIGTSNVSSYSINFQKPVRLSKQKFESPFLKIRDEKHTKLFNKPKLLIKEVATELTVAYDSGIFANLTGIYMFYPHNPDMMKILTLILNSDILNVIFSSLFSGTHLAGGYLRFNGSYLKELPIIIPEDVKLQNILTKLANYQLFLAQNQQLKEITEVGDAMLFLKSLSDFLVDTIYFERELQSGIISTLNSNLEEIDYDNWFLELFTDHTKSPDTNYLESKNNLSILKKILSSCKKLEENEIMAELISL